MVISIWSDPSNYINLLFLIRHYLKKKINIILICQKIEIKNNFYYFVKKNKYLKIIEVIEDGKLGYIEFYKKKQNAIKKNNPDTIISVNFISLFVSSLIFKKKNINWIYYNFDFDLTKDLRLKNFFEKYIIKYVNYIFLPSDSRVKLYKKKFLRKNNIFALYNCFSKFFKIKTYNSSQKYKLLKKNKYLVRLGSFYKFHYLEEIALSTKFWDRDFYLVMAGKSYDRYFDKLKEFIKRNNLKKIILLENISYQLWFTLLKNAFAGFALYKPINVSHKLMGGTSQKLNNYIFAGIPSIVSKSEDILKFNKIYSTSVITNNSPKDIAKRINFLINNKKFYLEKLKKNKRAFDSEFNFEKQIRKVEKLII